MTNAQQNLTWGAASIRLLKNTKCRHQCVRRPLHTHRDTQTAYHSLSPCRSRSSFSPVPAPLPVPRAFAARSIPYSPYLCMPCASAPFPRHTKRHPHRHCAAPNCSTHTRPRLRPTHLPHAAFRIDQIYARHKHQVGLLIGSFFIHQQVPQGPRHGQRKLKGCGQEGERPLERLLGLGPLLLGGWRIGPAPQGCLEAGLPYAQYDALDGSGG